MLFFVERFYICAIDRQRHKFSRSYVNPNKSKEFALAPAVKCWMQGQKTYKLENFGKKKTKKE
jgi:hypothetical protein